MCLRMHMACAKQDATFERRVQEQRDKEFGNINISADVFTNMQQYMDSVQLKRTTLSLIASRIPEDQI